MEIKDILELVKSGGTLGAVALLIVGAIKWLWPAYIAQVDKSYAAQASLAAAAQKTADACEERIIAQAQMFAEHSQQYVDSMAKAQEQNLTNWRQVTAAMIDVVRSQERLADRIETLGDRRK